jgi:transposase
MTNRDKRHVGNAEKTVRDIRRATRRRFSAEEKIRIVLEGLRGEEFALFIESRNGDLWHKPEVPDPCVSSLLWGG